MKIWKYELSPSCEHYMPDGAQVLSVQVQGGRPTLWALVDASRPMRKRRFTVQPTGLEFDATGCEYLGTFQLERGALVFHAFERKG